jgi:hypothetical protein
MSYIPFPDVPFALGVPSIPRSVNFPPSAGIVLSTIQGALWRTAQINNQWGIFDSNGNKLANVELFGGTLSAFNAIGGATQSTVSVKYSRETNISQFPVERGSFASYNKVQLPSEPIVTMSVTGDDQERTKFLNAIDEASLSTDLYDVITPDAKYIGYSIERYDFERTAEKGAYLLTVQIYLKEVRQVTASFQFIESPKDPNSESQVNNGVVQPIDARSSAVAKLPASQ